MTKVVLRKLAPVFIGIGILTPTAYFTYNGYIKSIAPSPFESAAKRLGFNGYEKAEQTLSAAEQQEALLRQFQMAGYFHPEKVWEAVNHLGVKDPKKTFKEIYFAVKKSKADQNDPAKFNAKILRKNLGKGTELDTQDAMDLILYTAQNAFGRKPGQERNELTAQDWMNKYKQEYFESAKILRLIDRETPTQQQYDGAWIAGASRIGVWARIIDYDYTFLKYNIKVKGETSILAGERGLWANIDGITPIVRDKLLEAYKSKKDLDIVDISLPVGEDKERVKEGQEYMLGLAARSRVKLDPSQPFIEYTTKEDCPPGYFPGRVYPKYDNPAGRKLTETLMSQDLLNTYPPAHVSTITMVDTLADQHLRPTTASTAKEAALRVAKDIVDGKYGNQKELVFLLVTNNPYIERQTLTTQRVVNEVLENNKLSEKGYKIKVEGIGFKCKQDVATVHSELAALIAEKWKDATAMEAETASVKRPIEKLLFQTRDNASVNEPQPDISEISVSGSTFQDLFDKYLS